MLAPGLAQVRMRTVVIVDDEPVDRFITEQIIIRSGQAWKIVTFPNASKALNFISFMIGHGGQFPELVLCDMLMPVSDGLEFLRGFSILANGRAVRSRVVILTTSENRERNKKALALGASTVVIKPFTPEVWAEISRSIPE